MPIKICYLWLHVFRKNFNDSWCREAEKSGTEGWKLCALISDHFAFILRLLVLKTYLACSNKHLLVKSLYTENLIKTRIFESWYMYYIESQFSRLNQYPLDLPPQSLFFNCYVLDLLLYDMNVYRQLFFGYHFVSLSGF